MLIRLVGILLLSSVCFISTSCRQAPINASERTQVAQFGKSAAEVKAAILDAGKGIGWIMEEKQPGVIQGKILVRQHWAMVNIPYSDSEYRIEYVSSNNLDYDGETINRSYNNWVHNLDNQIQFRLVGHPHY